MEEPLHRRIVSELHGRIADGSLPVGAPVPSESQLCVQWAASRGTVRQALGTLRTEGLIGGGRGRAPVVLARQLPQPFDTLLSFSRWAADRGRTPGQRTLELARRPAGPAVAQVLAVAVGTPVVELLRLRSLDGVPTMIERAAFVEPVGRLLFDLDLDQGSIYAHLIERGVELTTASHEFDAVPADAADVDLLGVPPGAPLLRERRRVTGPAGQPYEYSDDRYRPELVTFTVENAIASPSSLRRNPSQAPAEAAPRPPATTSGGT